MKKLFKGLFFGIENIHSARSIITIFLIFLLFVVLLGKTVGMSSFFLWQFIVIIPIIFISFIIISGPLLKHSVEIRIFTLTVTILIGWIFLEFILPMIYGVNLSDASINDIIIGHREDVNKESYEWWSESTQIPTNKITNGLSSLPFYILGISPFIGFFTLIISFYIPWIPKSIKEEEDYYLRTGWINYLAGGSGKELIKLKGPQYVNEILKYGILFCLNIFILFYFFLHFSTHIFFN